MRKKKKGNIAVKFAFILTIVLLILVIVNVQFEIRDLKKKKIEEEQRVQQLQDKIDELTIRINSPVETKEDFERIAWERYDYRYPTDIIYHNIIAN